METGQLAQMRRCVQLPVSPPPPPSQTLFAVVVLLLILFLHLDAQNRTHTPPPHPGTVTSVTHTQHTYIYLRTRILHCTDAHTPVRQLQSSVPRQVRVCSRQAPFLLL